MTHPSVTLDNCDLEPIHILGKVQSHGFLVAFHAATGLICCASNNVANHIGRLADPLLGTPIQQLFFFMDGQGDGSTLLQTITSDIPNGFEDINPIPILIQAVLYDLVVHMSGTMVVLEFEIVSAGQEAHLQNRIGPSLSKVIDAPTLQQTVAEAAIQVRKLTGYDRVMVYRFWEDGHGEVIAEAKAEDLEPLLGLHYPASDIPQQARRLYTVNLTRVIADVDAPTSHIIPASILTDPIDLTHSTLRAVSTMHIQYLQNMGVKASFSVSILHDGELWGLIACHHNSAKSIGYKAREQAKIIGKVVSSSFQYKADRDKREDALTYMQAAEGIVMEMHKKWDVYASVVDAGSTLLKVTDAAGAAVLFGGHIYKQGITPTDEQIKGLATWLVDMDQPVVYQTACLSKQFEQAATYTQQASGLLACTLSKALGEFVLFFKPEVLTTVVWAGDPQKHIEKDKAGNFRISPRHSFTAWSQEVVGTSEQWSRVEVATAVKFREDIVHLVNLKSNEVRKLNEKLKDAYTELDTFCSTVSHDLRTPLALVKNYAQILLMMDDISLEDRHLYLHRILKSEEKMEALINQTLIYSKVDAETFVKETVPMVKMLEELKMEVLAGYQETSVDLIYHHTPDILGNPIMVNQVFSNVIGNAVKYCSKSKRPTVSIDASENDIEVTYRITDNGVGIETGQDEQVFGLFKRLPRSEGFTGNGVGLSIVKRIMMKHDGRVWYQSDDNSTTFFLAFPK